MKKNETPPGVWIASTDIILNGEPRADNFDWSSSPSALLFTIKCQTQLSDNYGVAIINQDSSIQEISFEKPSDANFVDIVGGIVYLKGNVTETLVSLITRPPLDCCTYLGADNGEISLQVYIIIAASSKQIYLRD